VTSANHLSTMSPSPTTWVFDMARWEIGHFVKSKNKEMPDPKEIIEITWKGQLPSKDYPFRQGKGYSKETIPDPGFTRVVVRNVNNGTYSWPRAKDLFYLGDSPDNEPIKLPKEKTPVLVNIAKRDALILLVEDLFTLFSLSHIDQYHQSEINETLAPYKARLEKLKG